MSFLPDADISEFDSTILNHSNICDVELPSIYSDCLDSPLLHSSKCENSSNAFDITGSFDGSLMKLKSTRDKHSDLFDITNPFETTQTKSKQAKFSDSFDINATLDSTDFLAKDIEDGLKVRDFGDDSLHDEILKYKQLLTDVNRARTQRNVTKLIVDTLENVFLYSSMLPDDLKAKCCDYIRFQKLVLKLGNSAEFLKTIGVDFVPEFPYLDRREIKLIHTVLQEALEQKCADMKRADEVAWDLLGNRSRNSALPGSTLTEEKAKTLTLINDTCNLVERTFETALSVRESIFEMEETRIHFREIEKEELANLLSKTKSLGFHLRTLTYKITNSIIQQHDKMSQAVDTLHKELKRHLDDTEYSLQRTISIKESYDDLAGTKFGDILQEFLELREKLKHKTWALEQIHKK